MVYKDPNKKRQYDRAYEHAPKRRAYKRAWHLAHKADQLAKQKVWRDANPDKMRSSWQRYYSKNKVAILEQEKTRRRSAKELNGGDKQNDYGKQLTKQNADTVFSREVKKEQAIQTALAMEQAQHNAAMQNLLRLKNLRESRDAEQTTKAPSSRQERKR